MLKEEDRERLETGECSPVSQTLLIQKPYRLDLKRVEMMAYVIFVLICVSALVAEDSCSSFLQIVQHLSDQTEECF